MSPSGSGCGGGVGGMDQWVTGSADKPPDLSSIPETHIEKGEDRLDKSSSDSTQDTLSLVE